MKKEEELLLQDLTSRLSFGVMCEYKNETCSTIKPLLLTNICRVKTRTGFIHWGCYFEDNGGRGIPVEIVRPYLRPMSSMTEEEQFQLGRLLGATSYNLLKGKCSSLKELLEYFYKKHIDLFGLIPKGLALKATEDMYKNI